MSKAWGGIGAWAADVERAEEEERELQNAAAATPQLPGATESQAFPSLKEAAAKPKKKKAMTLHEFSKSTYVVHGGTRHDLSIGSKGLTSEEMIRLPKGPKERSAEEMEYGRLGGGFIRSGGMRGSRGDDGDGSWGGGGGRRSYGGFDDERRVPPPRVSQIDQPSRADEVDNWAMSKKPPPSMGSGRIDRYGSLGSVSERGGSRADEVDNWAMSKKPIPSMGSGRIDRYGSLGSRNERGGSRADEVDNWAIGKKPIPVRSKNFGSGFKDSAFSESDRWSRGGSQYVDHERPRPRLVLEPPQSDGSSNESAVKMTKSSPFGAARPREEVLAEKGLDWRKMDLEIETRKVSRPTSSHSSSRPSTSQSSLHESQLQRVLEGETKVRPKVNPFGDAKPREVLLQEKGKDWRKIDRELEHRGIDRPESEEEKLLKEEIVLLKKELEKEAVINANGESIKGSGGEQTSLHELILHKERDLEILICELDDKIRFGQRATDRPGSGSGRGVGFHQRPPSQSGVPEGSRILEFMNRPQSRGMGDDKRGFLGSRERAGFLSNRDIGRSKSRERW